MHILSPCWRKRRQIACSPTSASVTSPERVRTTSSKRARVVIVPLSLRKANLARLSLAPRQGHFIAEYEQGDIGHDLFRVACNTGLEVLVSKRRDRAYGADRCGYGIKVTNRGRGLALSMGNARCATAWTVRAIVR
jgi:hypothetical protein